MVRRLARWRLAHTTLRAAPISSAWAQRERDTNHSCWPDYFQLSVGGLYAGTLGSSERYFFQQGGTVTANGVMLGYRYESASRVFFHLYFAPILFQNRNTETPCLDCPIPLDRNAINPSGGIGAGIAF